MARGDGGLWGAAQALIPLPGVLLAVHHVPAPKVAPHPQVETAVCACVALRVSEAVVHDAHGLRAVERRAQGQARDKHGVWHLPTGETISLIFRFESTSELQSSARMIHVVDKIVSKQKNSRV